MNPRNHKDYYLRRAEISRGLAQKADDPAVAAIHGDFALRYEMLAVDLQPGERAELKIVQAA